MTRTVRVAATLRRAIEASLDLTVRDAAGDLHVSDRDEAGNIFCLVTRFAALIILQSDDFSCNHR